MSISHDSSTQEIRAEKRPRNTPVNVYLQKHLIQPTFSKVIRQDIKSPLYILSKNKHKMENY
jgi:hypothetical protein